ncbi:MAG TPA: hypothetical protein VLC92_01295 [Rhodocyclaceae bacterium]|nr:hypothetical protein [Rhodocyclaceae bacterium]
MLLNLAVAVALILLILLACAIYRVGQVNGYDEGYDAGLPKFGEVAQLREQVASLQLTLETQTACAARSSKTDIPFHRAPA